MTVRWGILGTGRMARAFAADLPRAPGAQLCAVGSRDAARAADFAAAHAGCRGLASYSELVQCPEVDVVYVATPHAFHHEHALLALDAGKHVLCEKPFTLNVRQAQAVVARAREKRLFLMEAMWTRFVPAVVRLRELVAEGAIGKVQLMVAGGAFIPEFNPEHYLFNPRLGGGVLLDAGVYLVSMASMLFGAPRKISAIGELGRSGVDEHDGIMLLHPGGALAALYVSLRARASPDVHLLGDRGRLRGHPPMFGPKTLTLSVNGREDEVLQLPFDGGGYQFQVMEVMRCLERGETGSAVMPPEESIRIMDTLDEVRAQLELFYPGE